MERRLAAIVAADVVGYSGLIRADEEGTLLTLRTLREELIDPKINEYHGRIVKLMGDGMLVEFASVVDAVACSVEVQRALATHNSSEKKILFRVGVNLGDVVIDGDDIQGDGVNVASRLEALSDPGGICISDAVHEQVRDRLDLKFQDFGKQEVKNLDRPVQAWKWSASGGQSAPDLSESRTSLPPTNNPSIAVLPFDNMSGDPEQEYFADGISEDVITDLSKITSLFVIARNSSFVYKGKTVDIPTIASELGVQFVLEGSVRRGGSRIRVTAQLIDASTGGHLWAERYDRDLTDIFDVQDEVTANIVRALSITLGKEEERLIGLKATENVAAYEYVLRARELILSPQQENTNLIKDILNQAIELDDGLGTAYAYLALVHALEWINGWSEDSQASLELAHELARKGVELTPDDAHVHIALGSVLVALRRYDEGIAEAEYAVQLSPNYAHGLFELGWYLQYAGRAAESLSYFDRAVRLDPHHSDMFLHFMAQAYFQLGRYEKAAELLRRRIARNPRTDSSRMLLAACYGYLNQHDEARRVWSEVREINPDFSIEQRRKVLPYKNPEDFEKIVTGLRKAGISN